jgi:hypothetical protein
VRFAHAAGWLALAALVAACRPAGAGTLRAEWASLDTALGHGDLKVPVRGTWCASRGRLTLLGFEGDTGVGILVRTVKLAPGLFQVSDTVAARSPGATIAFRLANRQTLFTLSGDSGAVAITGAGDGELEGRFVGWFTRPGAGPVVLKGRFEGVPVMPDTVRCESISVPEPAPAPVPAPAADSGVS